MTGLGVMRANIDRWLYTLAAAGVTACATDGGGGNNPAENSPGNTVTNGGGPLPPATPPAEDAGTAVTADARVGDVASSGSDASGGGVDAGLGSGPDSGASNDAGGGFFKAIEGGSTRVVTRITQTAWTNPTPTIVIKATLNHQGGGADDEFDIWINPAEPLGDNLCQNTTDIVSYTDL